MKKIENKREVVNTVTDILYEAVDGTIFHNEEECHKYESTVEAILLSKVKEFMIKEIPGSDLLESNDEGIYRIVVPKEEKHIDILNQLWKLNGGASKDNLLFSTEDLDKVIAIGIRYYETFKIDWIWFWKINDVIKSITDNDYTLVRITKIPV